VGKTIVFNGKMGMRKFGSAALPFSKVVYVVKGSNIVKLTSFYNTYLV